MFKKGNNIFSLLIIILSVFVTSSSNIVQADGSSEPNQGITSTDASDADKTPVTAFGDSLITSTQLKNEDGTPDYNTNKTMSAKWTFSTELNNEKQVIHDGDTMTVKVPDQLAISNDLSGIVSQSGDKDPNDALGDLNLNKNTKTINVTFNQHAADLSKTGVITGSFEVDSISWDVNTDFSKPIVLNWTTKGTASQPEPGLNTTVNVTKPSLPDDKEILFKYGGFVGTTIEWTVRINYRKDDIKDAIYKDTIGPNQRLLHDADHPIVAYPVTFDQTTGAMTEDTSNGSIITDKDIKINDTSNNGTPGFTASLGEITQPVILKYTTQATTSQGTDVTDSSQMSAAYGNTGDLLSNTTELQNITANLTTNKLGGEGVVNTSITSMVGTKLWDLPSVLPEGINKPDSVTIDLLKSTGNGDPEIVDRQTAGVSNNWTYGFYNLPQYDKYSGEKITYSVQEDPKTAPGFTGTVSIPDSTHSTTLQNIVNTVTPDKTKFKVTKVWNDNKNAAGLRPTEVTVGLYNGAGVGPANYNNTITLGVDKDHPDKSWTGEFTNIPPTGIADPNWYVSENGIDNYVHTADRYNFNNPYDKDIVNTLATSLTVTKKWLDNNGKDITENTTSPIKVQLYQNDNGTTSKLGGEITLSSDNKWTHTFEINEPTDTRANPAKTTKLPMYDNDGNKITYHAEEVTSSIPTGYVSTQPVYSEDHTEETITNKQIDTTKPTTSFTVSKDWVGDDNNSKKTRPDSIQVQLKANDNPIGLPVTLNEGNNWKYNWDKLDKTANDKDIKYTVSEINAPEGYTSTTSYPNSTTATITNKLDKTPSGNTGDTTTNVKVTKIWSDNNNQDKLRPSSVTVNLLKADDTNVDSAVLNSDNNWTHEFTGLDKSTKYHVTEDEVDNYTTNINQTDPADVKITNTHTPSTTTTTDDKTNLNVTKTWSDSNNKDNLRPSQVTIHLFKDGTEVGSAVLNEDNNWAHNFTGLDKTSTYTVSEDAVSGYTSNIDDEGANGVKITNTHTPSTTTTTKDDKTNLTVNKLWNDSNNKDSLLPSQVTVHLLKNGSVIGQAVQLSSLNAWSYTWNNLDKNGNYSVQEDTVSGYTAAQSTNNNVITITNTHTPKTPGNPNNPGNPFTPDNPGGNNGNNGSNGGTGDQVNTGNGGGGSNTTTDFTPGNPMVPSVPYQKTNTSNGLLPQTGSKNANILYSILGVLILGFISIFELKRKRA
ncbi:Cna B-type domain-containing protein [Companilactobacillus muriivasis]|uniref:Cna B-type domain-containing protein n=1 Tax=Companilactobacillus muriivasis TaxID=3081444 RepID=UPI0030C772A1